MKKDKLYIMLCIISLLSIIVAIILKLFKIDWFIIKNIEFYDFIKIQYIISFVILCIQFYLIIGIITSIKPKKLFFKIIPFLPLNIFLYVIPDKHYFLLNVILLFVVALGIKTTGKTLMKFVFSIIIISIIQILLLWIKLDYFKFTPIQINIYQLIIFNIDQFIVLSLLYYLSIKAGDKYFSKLAIYRRSK